MKLVAGVDIGNSTTEVCVAEVDVNGTRKFISSALTKTTGIKGTVENCTGVIIAIKQALAKVSIPLSYLEEIRLNEAAPVIGDTAMETISETIITESTMIGHNPETPGGIGLGIGYTVELLKIKNAEVHKDYVVLVEEKIPYNEASKLINEALQRGIKITAAIIQKDEGVLINNRINKIIPIVDEVKFINKIPENVLCAVEVSSNGYGITTLSNPYGIATIFNLTAEETKNIVPVAKSLTGLRSAVVIKTPKGEVKDRIIKAGALAIETNSQEVIVDVDNGAEAIMKVINDNLYINDINGEKGTNIGSMLSSVKFNMAKLTDEKPSQIKIKDLLAIDTYLPVKVQGALAGETFMEKAVAMAAMVKTDKLPMLKIAKKLEEDLERENLQIQVTIGGIEAVMATLGSLSTPGTALPLCILDLGGGSTDAAFLNEKGDVKTVHLAGAGELVTMLINSELGLNDRNTAEEIKKYPLAKVENLFQIRMENREIKFFDEPLNPKFFGRVVILKDKELIPIYSDLSIDRIVEVRRSAKERVFVANGLRALKAIAPNNNLRNISSVVLVGGSSIDFEIPQMITKELSKYKIVAGRGNIRGSEGPRNAVATGLVMSYGR